MCDHMNETLIQGTKWKIPVIIVHILHGFIPIKYSKHENLRERK